MKPTAYLINISRGPIVDEAALVDALRKQTIAGAGLDTYDIEPLPKGHPLLLLTNTILTPHLGYTTEEGFRAWYGGVPENIKAFVAGEPIRVINPEVLNSPQLRGPG